MTNHDGESPPEMPPDLSSDLKELLRAEQARPGMPDAARARLAERLGVATPGPNGNGGEARVGAPGAVGDTARALAWRIGVLGFVVGAAAGAVLHSLYDHRSAAVHESAADDRRVPASSAIAESPPPVAPAIAPSPAVAAAPAPAIAAVTSPALPAAAPTAAHTHHGGHGDLDSDPSRDTDLGAERALLETARTALSRGQSDAALATLALHARRFPTGRLAEERESLWVQALVQAGRGREARERGERFGRRFPDSMLRSAVDAALGKLD